MAAPQPVSTFNGCLPSNEADHVAHVDPPIVGALGHRGRAVLEVMHIEGGHHSVADPAEAGKGS
jgi:hypothetical protein